MTPAFSRFTFALTLATLGTTGALATFAPAAHAQAQMSETEKKAAARSAYTEGVQLEESGKFAEALARFEAAQKLYDAPTHQLHIARCQAKTGRLVEASEHYEALTRRSLPADAPDAFKQAQEQAKTELADTRPRIPTLRVVIKPEPNTLRDLRVSVNGTGMPNELINIARPINPGTYRVQASAQGYVQQSQVPDTAVAERDQKTVEITLVQGTGAPVVVAPPPGAGQQPPPYSPNPGQPAEQPGQPDDGSPTQLGLLLGARVGGSIPGGSVDASYKMEDFATAGGGFGIDGYFRLVKMLLLGFTFEYGALGSPATIPGIVGSVKTTASSTYFGAAIGIIPNVEKVSFIGDVGLGRRQGTLTIEGNSGSKAEVSASGLEFAIGAGVSIPAGKLIRLVPRANVTVGNFSEVCGPVSGTSNTQRCNELNSSDKATHTFIFVGLGLYFNVPFRSSGGAAANTPAPIPYLATPSTPAKAPAAGGLSWASTPNAASSAPSASF